MAKKREFNKTQAVRDYLKDHPDAQNKDIAAALTEKGIEITASHVAAIKTKLNMMGKAKRRPKPVAVTQALAATSTVAEVVEKPAKNGNITLEQVKKVAQTVKALGGYQKMTEVLETIKEAGGPKKFKELAEAMTVTEPEDIVF